MISWLLLGAGVLVLAGSAWLRDRGTRAAGQGLAVLLAAAGVLLAFRRPDGWLHLPGHGPRRWTNP